MANKVKKSFRLGTHKEILGSKIEIKKVNRKI